MQQLALVSDSPSSRFRPRSVALRRLVVLLWRALVPLLVWPGAAFAQTIQPITDIAVTRDHEAEDRQAGKPFFYISREDCLADDRLTFDLDIVGPDSSSTFQVWAGDDDDCTNENNRAGNDPRCWLVYQGTLDSTSELVSIPVQNIAARRLPTETNGGVSTGTRESCSNDLELGITLFFMHVSGGATSGNVQRWTTKLDLKGPSPPENVEAGIGDERLVVTWDTTTSTRSGYKIYCEATSTDVSELSGRFAQGRAALALDAGAAGAGNGGTAGAGSGGTPTASAGGSGPAPSEPSSTSSAGTTSGGASGSGSACGSLLRAGQLPPAEAEVCGEVDIGASERGIASGLMNSVVYAIAVASVDELENPGPLSNVSCQAPEDLDEFFEAYRRMGGKGGGGFCSLARLGAGVSNGAAASALLCVALLFSTFVVRRGRR